MPQWEKTSVSASAKQKETHIGPQIILDTEPACYTRQEAKRTNDCGAENQPKWPKGLATGSAFMYAAQK